MIKKYAFAICLIAANIINIQLANGDDWSADLDYYKEHLDRLHYDLYHTISEKEFDEQLDQIRSNLNSLTDDQIKVVLMRLTRMIGAGKSDGHTSIPLWNTPKHRFPIEIVLFGDENRIVAAHQNYSFLVGTRLMSIDNTPVEKIRATISKITPFTENVQSKTTRTSNYMLISELLHASGYIDDKNKALFRFIDDENNEIMAQLEALPEGEFSSSDFINIYPKPPIRSRQDKTDLESISFSIIESRSAAYVKLKRYPSFDEMDAFSQNLSQAIEQNNLENLIIDLRDNYGGDFFIGLVLANQLNLIDQIDWNNGVYVLTNRKTYSAAMVNATQFRQILNATLIGEPTGANPNGPQDMGSFTLPHSGLLVTYSKRNFRFQAQNTQGVIPDIYVPYNWQSYKSGTDLPLKTALDEINKK